MKAHFGAAAAALLALGVSALPLAAHAADQKAYPVDAFFAREAAALNNAELKINRHVADHAATVLIKRDAKMMVNDHTAAGDQLKHIADRLNVDLSDDPDTAHQKFLDDLEDMKGADYERAYAQQMVADHQVAIALFKDEAERGNDRQLKDFAKQTLPKLQAHLKSMQDAERSMKGTGRAQGAVL